MAISDEDVIDELESSGHAVDDYVIVETDVCIVDRDGRPLPLLIEDYPGEEEGALYYAIIDFLRRRGSPEYRSFEEFDEQAKSGEVGSPTVFKDLTPSPRACGLVKKQSPWWWKLLACIGVPVAYFFMFPPRLFDLEQRASAAVGLLVGINAAMAVTGRFSGALFVALLLTFIPLGPWGLSKWELFLVNAVPGLLGAALAARRGTSRRARNGP